MIRKNPSGDLPVIAESAYVDKTAIICGKVIIVSLFMQYRYLGNL